LRSFFNIHLDGCEESSTSAGRVEGTFNVEINNLVHCSHFCSVMLDSIPFCAKEDLIIILDCKIICSIKATRQPDYNLVFSVCHQFVGRKESSS
jgi:hypothetical protein